MGLAPKKVYHTHNYFYILNFFLCLLLCILMRHFIPQCLSFHMPTEGSIICFYNPAERINEVRVHEGA